MTPQRQREVVLVGRHSSLFDQQVVMGQAILKASALLYRDTGFFATMLESSLAASWELACLPYFDLRPNLSERLLADVFLKIPGQIIGYLHIGPQRFELSINPELPDTESLLSCPEANGDVLLKFEDDLIGSQNPFVKPQNPFVTEL